MLSSDIRIDPIDGSSIPPIISSREASFGSDSPLAFAPLNGIPDDEYFGDGVERSSRKYSEMETMPYSQRYPRESMDGGGSTTGARGTKTVQYSNVMQSKPQTDDLKKPSISYASRGLTIEESAYAEDVRVFLPFYPNSSSNLLQIVTVLLLLVCIARGVFSLVCLTKVISINVNHMHIVDTLLLVFAIFMIPTGIALSYMMGEYAGTTFDHKLAVMMPYIISVLTYGCGFIATIVFTKHYGSYVDLHDNVELVVYQSIHWIFFFGSLMTIREIPAALYAHRNPEKEYPLRYRLVPNTSTQ